MSSRRASAATFLIVASILLIHDQPGLGQFRQAPANAGQSQPPIAIDRGVIASDSRTFDSPEQMKLSSLRAVTRAPDRVTATGERYVSGRVIVKIRGGSSFGSRARAWAAIQRAAPGARMDARRAYSDFDVIEVGADEDPEAIARELARHADIEYAQASYRAWPRFVPNDNLYGQLQWNMPAIDMERAWDIQRGASSSIIVAVVDSGLDLDGHGTHVTGIIGQLTNNSVGLAGVAFNVRLMPVKVISGPWDDAFNSPFVGTDQTVALGIRYAVDNGARIINLSVGRTGGEPAPAVESAVRYAVGRGAFVAIAGGNDFERGNGIEVYAEIATRVQGAVAVAATDRAGNRAHYSSTGSYIELAAPGGSFRVGGDSGLVYQQSYDFIVTDTYLLPPSQLVPPRFDIFATIGNQGTSMAAPHVSGVAALLMQQGVTSPAAIEAALERFADDRGPTGRDEEYGFGVINARAALRGLGLAR
jgi:serine protease